MVASDESARPELREEGLATWKPEALYRAAWFDRQAATMTLSTANLDPWSGRSIHQIAMASRGQHRSQDMGRLQDLGPRETRLAWVAGAGGVAATSPFSGIDTRLRALAALVPEGKSRQEVASRLERVEALAHAARGRLHAADPSAVVAPLREILAKLREARERARLAARIVRLQARERDQPALPSPHEGFLRGGARVAAPDDHAPVVRERERLAPDLSALQVAEAQEEPDRVRRGGLQSLLWSLAGGSGQRGRAHGRHGEHREEKEHPVHR